MEYPGKVSRTNNILTFDGQVPVSADVYLHKSRWFGARLRITWKNKEESNCGYRAKLPKILPASNTNGSASSRWTSGNDWSTSGYDETSEPFAGHLDAHYFCPTCPDDVPKDYRP